MVFDDTLLLVKLQEVANAKFDGHLSIMKFTTNWRVGFRTPNFREDIDNMATGQTFSEAATRALERAGA